ncbi:MAG: hypothetical protein ACREEL_09435 [Stellaceae bacterium]
MKLSAPMLKRTLDQLEEQPAFHDAEVVPEDNPAIEQLNQLFGEHTFFLDGDGLHIVEPTASTAGGTPMGVVIKLASWRDARRTSLKPQPPEPTDVVIALAPDGIDADEAEEGGDPAA